MAQKDGGWGWVIVLSGFFIGFLCDGIRSSYGFIYLEFLREFKESKSVTSWVGSIMFGLMNFLGPVTSSLVHRFGCRAVTVAGGLVCALGYIVSVFGTSVYHLYISLGVLGGVGFSMLVIPFNVILIQYFEKRRALAMGIAVCGSGVGSIVFSPLSKLLIDEFGWRGTLLIEGALVLHCVPCGLVMRPILTGRRKKVNIETERIIPDRFGVKQSLLQNGIDLEVVQTNSESSTTLNISNEAKLLQINTTTSELNGNATSSLQEQVTVTKDISPNEERLLYRKWILKFRDLFHVELLKNGAFLIMILSYLCEGLAYSVPFTFLPDMTVTLGYSRQQASWLLSTVAIANTVSRIPIGMIADIRCVNRLYVYIAGLTGVGVCICLIAFAKAYILLICICVFYGVFIGCYVVLLPLVLADLFGDDRIADTKGLTCFTNGIAGLIGLPIAGALFDISGQYTLTFMMSAVGYMLAGFVLLFTNRCKWS